MQQSLYRMPVEIKKVRNRKQLREFVNFPERLYKDNPYYVPPLVFDQMDTLDQEKGAAQEFCKSGLYLAYKDGRGYSEFQGKRTVEPQRSALRVVRLRG